MKLSENYKQSNKLLCFTKKMFISEAHCYHYVLLFLVAYKNVRFFLLLSIAAKKDPAAGETF